MLWRRNQPSLPTGFVGPMSALALVPEPPAPPVVPLSRPAFTALLDNEYFEYQRLLTTIGIVDCADFIDEKMRRCLVENNIERYNDRDVHKYLDETLSVWHWRGLRTRDLKEKGGEHYVLDKVEYHFGYDLYTAAVPLPVLLTIEKIQNAVPEMCFYVSQKGRARPLGDPFLLCTCKKSSGFIVERWDEPGFRQGTK